MIPLPLIFDARQDLQIALDMQTADDQTSNWHDVINLMADSGGARQPSRFSVESSNGLVVRPCWRGLSLRGIAFGNQCVHFVRVVFSPLAVLLLQVCRIGRSPSSTPVLSMGLVPLLPLREGVWMCLIPDRSPFIDAVLAVGRQSITSRTVHTELYKRLHDLTDGAVLQVLGSPRCILVPQRPQHRISEMRLACLANGWHATGASMRSRSSWKCLSARPLKSWLTEIAQHFFDMAMGADFSEKRRPGRPLRLRDGAGTLARIGQALLTMVVSVAFLGRQAARAALIVSHTIILSGVRSLTSIPLLDCHAF